MKLSYDAFRKATNKVGKRDKFEKEFDAHVAIETTDQKLIDFCQTNNIVLTDLVKLAEKHN